MILTNCFIKRKIRSLAEKGTERYRCFRGLKEATTILVIYDVKDSEIVAVCLESFRMMHKQVRTLVYGMDVSGKEDDSAMVLCTKSDLDCWGFPKAALSEKFKSVRADILIDLSRPYDYAARYLMLLHPCCFKIGAKSDGQDLYDLNISVTDGDNIKHLFGHILFYLQSIRSK